MPISQLHRQVATIALRAAAQHGFALGGGNALLAHGIITRPTQDVDLFSNREGSVEAAASSVEAALRAAGLVADRRDQTEGLADIFPGMGEGLAEWIVTGADGQQMLLQMAYFDRDREPVAMDLGPVLDIQDVAGGKVCALAGRVEPRDYADTAAMLHSYSPSQLIAFARRLDPGLTDRDFADAGRRLDQMPDEAFRRVGLSRPDIARLRARFADWPRLAPQRQVDLGADSGSEQLRLPGSDAAAQAPERPEADKEAGR
jgi:Nucleotidyl transferase AbiEii toxin, Type IV TA system